MSNREYWENVTYYVIRLLMTLIPFLLISALYAGFVDRNPRLVFSFLSSALFLTGLTIPFFKYRPMEHLRLRDSFKIAAIGWMAMSLAGALPFVISGYLSPIDAWFESMSGFTATGLTMFQDVESLPGSIILWRSLTQWVGGVGIIVLFISVMYRTSRVVQTLYVAEGRTDKIVPTIVGTTRRIWAIYAFYTLLAALLLIALGVPAFEATNVAMTALATGGFAPTNNSIAAYAPAVGYALIPFMMIGAISFTSHMQLFRGRVREFFNIEVRAMLILIAAVTLLTMGHMVMVLGMAPEAAAYQSSFHVTSALTGTGFSVGNLSTYTDYEKFLITGMMVVGGAYGSTSSALKLVRVVVLAYGIAWFIKRRLYPESAIVPFKIGRRIFDPSEVRDVAIYTSAYIFLLVAGALVFMAAGHTAADALFEVASAEGNVGLSVGITSPLMPAYQKIVLIVEMWMGRLEIFPVLVLFASPFKRY